MRFLDRIFYTGAGRWYWWEKGRGVGPGGRVWWFYTFFFLTFLASKQKCDGTDLARELGGKGVGWSSGYGFFLRLFLNAGGQEGSMGGAVVIDRIRNYTRPAFFGLLFVHTKLTCHFFSRRCVDLYCGRLPSEIHPNNKCSSKLCHSLYYRTDEQASHTLVFSSP